MSKYRQFAVLFILVELILFAGINVWCFVSQSSVGNRQYRVDISRVVYQMEHGRDISDIDLTEFECIEAVTKYDETAVYKNEYEVKSVNGQLICFEYKEKADMSSLMALDILVVLIILANIILIVYLDRKMIVPFARMNNLTLELAKGNLATPVKQEKSKFFGRFLWGIDMLRETLEDDRKRELELLKEKKTLVLSLSHDIKTPLSAIDLYAKALKKDMYVSQEEKNAAYEGIEKNIQEIKRYVQEINTASKEDFIAIEVNNSENYLVKIINQIKEHYEEKMQRLHIDFTVEPTEECMVYGDYDRIVEVLQNVIENAIKYGDGKHIGISVREEEDCKLVTVSNSGCKLSKEELPHIFESFYRGSNVGNQEGSGLGLYICKELMHRMDGEIFAQIGDNLYEVTVVLRKI